MKKRLGRSVLFAASLLASTALSYGQAELAIGLKGGLNFAKVDANTSVDTRTGFHAGPFLLIKVAKFGIQPELIFSQEGSKFKTDIQTFKQDLTYVNIPIMLKLYLAAGINLQAGPQFGILTSAKFDGHDVKDQVKGSDVSADFGLGWDLPFGLMIDARYILGLSNINDDPTSSETVKNKVFQVSLGYKIFKLGK